MAAIVGWIGSALLIVGTVLPERESTVFSGVADNTLIQSGRGIFYVVTGLVVAWRVYRTWTDRHKAVWIIFGGVWAAGWLVVDWMNGAKLYPIVNGVPDTSVAPEIASAGIGLYTIALGAALVAGAGIALLRTSAQPVAPAPASTPQPGLVTTCSTCRQIHDDVVCPRCGTSAFTSKLASVGSVMR